MLEGYLLTKAPLNEATKKDLRARWVEFYKGNAFRVMLLSDEPPIVHEIPSVTETLRRLDRAIANVRRFE
jgi:hypothetical protein